MFSTNDLISRFDTVAATFGISIGVAAFQTFTDTIAVPSLAPGTYFVGLVFDHDNLLGETDETNNTTFLNVQVTVPSGCP